MPPGSSSSGSTVALRPPCRPRPSPTARGRLPRVNIDYHVEIEHHYYRLPHALVHAQVDVRVSCSRTVRDLPPGGSGVAAHVRSRARGQHTTRHRPPCQGPPAPPGVGALRSWRLGADSRGPDCRAGGGHPRQPAPSRAGLPLCLGILRLAKRGRPDPGGGACARALAVGARSYRHVEAILKHGLDRGAAPRALRRPPPPAPGPRPAARALCTTSERGT